MKKVMFISSGGGHLTELLQLEPLFQQYQSMLVLEKQQYNLSLPYEIVYLPKGTRKKPLQYCFVFLWLCLKTCFYYFKYQPDVVVTTGAHTAVPMCYLAHLFKKKIIFIESIARVQSKSLTGKLIEKKCTHILVQWESMLELYPQATYVGQLL